jgi:hypothetical protein
MAGEAPGSGGNTTRFADREAGRSPDLLVLDVGVNPSDHAIHRRLHVHGLVAAKRRPGGRGPGEGGGV